MKEFCENPLCDNPAYREIQVSVNGPADQTRTLCATCEEVFTWGVRHGHMTAGENSITKAMQKGLHISPPSEEAGQNPFFRIVYAIDVEGSCAREAAKNAYQLMTDPASMRPILEVLDYSGNVTRVDLHTSNGAARASTNSHEQPVP